MSLNSGANPKVVKTAVDEVLFTEYDYPNQPGTATAETAELFKISGISNAAAIELEYGGASKWTKHAEEEDVEEDSVRTANATTHNVENWKKDLPIPKEFYDDDMHDVVNKSVADMGRKARLARDENALDIYGGGFDDHTTPDAGYLWLATHTNLNGDTISNLETGAFTGDNLEILVRSLYEQKDQSGELGGHDPVALLVPPILFPDAQEICKSELKANVTDNNLNYFSMIYPGLKIFQSAWVGSTYNSYTNAQTAYYLVGRGHAIRRKVREAINTTLVSWEYDKKDRWMYKGRYREVAYAGTWEGAVASNGTT